MVMDACIKAGYYRTPSCNEKLYLHFKGVDAIGDALEEYTEAKVLWIEGNVLSSLDGVSPCGATLRQLYAHQNALKSLGTSLAKCSVLDGLNVSDNYLTSLDGLDAQAETLSTLQAKNNKIASVEGIASLPQLRNLRVLDLSNNELEDGAAVLEVLKACPSLRALYLNGNPCVRTMRQYRKTVLAALPELLHLDDKPVFADERRLVSAWMRGGMEAERAEREAMRVEEAGAARRRLDDFRRLVYGARPDDVAAADAVMGVAQPAETAPGTESDAARQRRLADIVGEGSSESEEDDSSSDSEADEALADANGGRRVSKSNTRPAAAPQASHVDPMVSAAHTAASAVAAAAEETLGAAAAPTSIEDIDDVYIP
jgi:dynein assembly factor 1